MTPRAYNNRGNAWCQAGVRQGHRRLQRGHPARPQVRRAYDGRGYAWCDKKEYDKAIADYTEAIRLDPEIRRRLLQPRQRLDGRRTNTTRPSPITPRPSGSIPKSAALRQPRQCLVPTRRSTTRPSPIYTEAIRLDPEVRSAPTTTAARPGSSKKEYDKAIADYTEAIRLDPKYAVRLHEPRQRSGSKKRNTTRPSPIYTEAIRLDPKFGLAYSNRGLAWHDKKEYDKAIADYTEAIRLDPERRPTPTTTAATPGRARRSTTRPSPISTRPSGSTPATPALQRPCLALGDVSRRQVPGRQEGRRIGDEGM